jgi:hypothetical protein
MTTEYNWPSREEWAIRQRTAFAEETPYIPPKVTDYASDAEEINEAIFELKARWKVCGQEMAAAKRAARELAHQPDETGTQYVRRYYAMTEAEQELSYRPKKCRAERNLINEVIRALQQGELHWRARNVLSCSPILSRIWERYEAALQRASEARIEEIANTPIDDAAWEKELERRAEFENPGIEWVSYGGADDKVTKLS